MSSIMERCSNRSTPFVLHPGRPVNEKTDVDRCFKFLALNSQMMFIMVAIKLLEGAAPDTFKGHDLSPNLLSFSTQMGILVSLMSVFSKVYNVPYDPKKNQPEVPINQTIIGRPPVLNSFLNLNSNKNIPFALVTIPVVRFVLSMAFRDVDLIGSNDILIGFCKEPLQRSDTGDLTCKNIDDKAFFLWFFDFLLPFSLMSINAMFRKAEKEINGQIAASNPMSSLESDQQSPEGINVNYLSPFAWPLVLTALNTGVLSFYWGFARLVDAPLLAKKDPSGFIDSFGCRNVLSLLYALATGLMMKGYVPRPTTHAFSVYKNDVEGQFEKVGPASFLDKRHIERFPKIAITSALAMFIVHYIIFDVLCKSSRIDQTSDRQYTPKFCPKNGKQDLHVFGVFILMSSLSGFFDYIMNGVQKPTVQGDQQNTSDFV